MNNTEIINRPLYPPLPGMSRCELILQDADDNVIDYVCDEGPGLRIVPGFGKRSPPLSCSLGLLWPILCTIPTVGHNKFALDFTALTGWEMALGIGTGSELAADTALGSEITTYGLARVSVTPTVLNSVMTLSHKYTATTGAAFTVTEGGVFKNSILMMRHKYSQSTYVASTQKVTEVFTDTF
jgi:hypothetical protein